MDELSNDCAYNVINIFFTYCQNIKLVFVDFLQCVNYTWNWNKNGWIGWIGWIGRNQFDFSF